MFLFKLSLFYFYFKASKIEFDIMNEKLDVFSREMYELSKQQFSIISFEALINKIRDYVSEVKKNKIK
jgi:formate hydrogenlyase subunit 4